METTYYSPSKITNLLKTGPGQRVDYKEIWQWANNPSVIACLLPGTMGMVPL